MMVSEYHYQVSKGSRFDDLPVEIFYAILERTDVRTIYRSRAVSRSWNYRIKKEKWTAAWGREEPWVILQFTKGEQEHYEAWLPLSGSRFNFPHAQHIPPSVARSTFSRSSLGLVVSWNRTWEYTLWNPLTGVSKCLKTPKKCLVSPDIRMDINDSCYRLTFYHPTQAAVYDSKTEDFQDLDQTPEEYRRQGLPGCLALASQRSQSPLCYLKQLASAMKQFVAHGKVRENDKGGWELDLRDLHGNGGIVGMDVVERNGRCFVAAVAVTRESEVISLEVLVYEVVEATHEWKLVSSSKRMSRMATKKAFSAVIAFSDSMLLVSSLSEPASLSRPKVFNLDDLSWRSFDFEVDDETQITPIAVFKPNLLAVP